MFYRSDLANSHNYTKLLLIVDGEGAVTLSARKVKKATARKYVTQKGDVFTVNPESCHIQVLM